MSHTFFLLLYLATDRETLPALLRSGWNFAIFSTSLMAIFWSRRYPP